MSAMGMFRQLAIAARWNFFADDRDSLSETRAVTPYHLWAGLRPHSSDLQCVCVFVVRLYRLAANAALELHFFGPHDQFDLRCWCNGDVSTVINSATDVTWSGVPASLTIASWPAFVGSHYYSSPSVL